MCYRNCSFLRPPLLNHAGQRRKDDGRRAEESSRLAKQVHARRRYHLSNLQVLGLVYKRSSSTAAYIGLNVFSAIRRNWLSTNHYELCSMRAYRVHKCRGCRNSSKLADTSSTDARESVKKLTHKWQTHPHPQRQPIYHAAQFSLQPMRSGK